MQAWKGAAGPREESEALTLTSHLRGINAHLSTESCFLAVTFMVKEMSGMRRGKQRPLLPEEQAFCGVTAGSKPGVAGNLGQVTCLYQTSVQYGQIGGLMPPPILGSHCKPTRGGVGGEELSRTM